MIRELRATDIGKLRKIHDDKLFPFPNLFNSLCFDSNVIEENGHIMAAGISRLTSEGIFIVDSNLSEIKKVKYLIALIEYMKTTNVRKGMNECHVFCVTNEIQAVLFKLGFRPCKGNAMVLYF